MPVLPKWSGNSLRNCALCRFESDLRYPEGSRAIVPRKGMGVLKYHWLLPQPVLIAFFLFSGVLRNYQGFCPLGVTAAALDSKPSLERGVGSTPTEGTSGLTSPDELPFLYNSNGAAERQKVFVGSDVTLAVRWDRFHLIRIAKFCF